MKNHRTKLFLDIENLGNLLDSNAGRVERVRYEYKQQVANAVIVNNQYVYNNLDTSLNLETLNQSFWQVQIGVKYEF